MLTGPALIVFARQPCPGKVKTRLAKSIGYEKASEVYYRMLGLTLEQSSLVEASRYVFLPPGEALPDSLKPQSAFSFREQAGRDLGERMAKAFDDIFIEGHDRAVLIGSDCPYLTRKLLDQSFDYLLRADTVFGPAVDGGYYLVGQSTYGRDLFSGIQWSTDMVWTSTRERLSLRGWTHLELPVLEDVDNHESYSRWLEFLAVKCG